jgi:hypothetical protein
MKVETALVVVAMIFSLISLPSVWRVPRPAGNLPLAEWAVDAQGQ